MRLNHSGLNCLYCNDAIGKNDPHTIVDEQPVCESCYDDHCARCGVCGLDLHTNDAYFMYDRENYWCNSCFDSAGGHCEGCDNYFASRNLSTDRRDNQYCSSCIEDDCGVWNRRSDGETIYDYDTDVFWATGASRPTNTTRLYYGFELELNTHGDDDDRYDAANVFLKASNNRGIVKCDGSIGDGDSGIELVTLPLSLEELRRLALDIIEAYGTDDERVFADSSCGFHVHVSRAPLPTSTLAKLVRFVYDARNWDFMEYLAGRQLRESRWADLTIRSASWKALWHPQRRWFDDGNRYTAVNFCNAETIEFRIFAATMNAKRLCANIEACAALVAFCSTANSVPIANINSYRDFRSYVTDNRREYPHLCEHLTAYKEQAPLLTPSAALPF